MLSLRSSPKTTHIRFQRWNEAHFLLCDLENRWYPMETILRYLSLHLISAGVDMVPLWWCLLPPRSAAAPHQQWRSPVNNNQSETHAVPPHPMSLFQLLFCILPFPSFKDALLECSKFGKMIISTLLGMMFRHPRRTDPFTDPRDRNPSVMAVLTLQVQIWWESIKGSCVEKIHCARFDTDNVLWIIICWASQIFFKKRQTL